MDSIKGLIGTSLARHGIEREVTAHLVVKTAHEILQELLPPYAKNDIAVRSFHDATLRIACAHAIALSHFRQHETRLRERLVQKLPRIDLKRVECFIESLERGHDILTP